MSPKIASVLLGFAALLASTSEGGTLSGPANAIINSSARVSLKKGESVTLGFVIAGKDRQTVLIRAVTDGLRSFITTPVASSVHLTVWHRSTLLAENSMWSFQCGPRPAAGVDAAHWDVTRLITERALFWTTASAGAFPLRELSKDAALSLVLAEGAYCARVENTGTTDGEVLVEVYLVKY